MQQRALVVVPENLCQGLLYTLNLNFNHPTHTQLFQVVDSRFFFSNVANRCRSVTDSCVPCASLKQIPQEATLFPINEPPEHPGISFTADVIKTQKKLIITVVDNFSTILGADFIKTEGMEDLRDGLLTVLPPLLSPAMDTLTVWTNPSSGFKKLKASDALKGLGIAINLGKAKNKNKIAMVDTKIKDFRKALVRASVSSNNVISQQTLAVALKSVNNMVRKHGYSAKEILFSRDRLSGDNINLNNEEIASKMAECRKKDNDAKLKTQQKSRKSSQEAGAQPGSVVFLKEEGDKTKGRDLYLVVEVDDQRK